MSQITLPTDFCHSPPILSFGDSSSAFLSSKSILTEGVYVSSNWPLFIFQKKIVRNNIAIDKLIRINPTMIAIVSIQFVQIHTTESVRKQPAPAFPGGSDVRFQSRLLRAAAYFFHTDKRRRIR